MNKAICEKIAVGMGAGPKTSKALADACENWGITNPIDQARFFAQLHVESGGFKRLEENLNYSASRLLQVFPGRNGLNTMAEAVALVRGGPRMIANHVYGGEWGRENLGNVRPDDGWDFRGRSFIQTTGRDNYQRTSMQCYGDKRLLTNPDMLLGVEAAANVSAWFWHRKHLNGVSDIKVITKAINGGQHGLAERVKQTTRALNLVKFFTGT
jgi:putative chitinase